MPCYGPLYGYFSRDLNASGKRSIVFDKRKSFTGLPVMVPCGVCVGCRLSWRRQWAIRCMHEKRLHAASAFLTLTYDDEHLPYLSSLRLSDLQRFMKRLRRQRPTGLRMFACGEYGDRSLRPHYHVLLLNTDFPDRRYLKASECGESLFRSSELSELWPAGDSYIGDVTARSAAYVCGYVTKKVGEEVDYSPREPEFRVMSRRPGIGLSWLQKFHPEAYRHDSAIMDSHEVGLPRYYDTKVISEDLVDNVELVRIKRLRKAKAIRDPDYGDSARMRVRERFELLKLARFQRDV